MIAKPYSGHGSIRRGALALAAAPFLAGCFTYPVNPALTRYEPTAGYRFCNRSMGPGNSDRNFVIVTLSGGGTRAAAFAYGALRQLEETPVGHSGFSLLDEVDVISSVSGGSFAAGYYGAHGKEAFLRSFPDDVLYRKIERDLILRLACPWFWPRLLSPWYGRSDLADGYYDRHIFRGASFRDLPVQRPLIQLNATDISLGASFAFVQDDSPCASRAQ
jgi:predicted acylesterase/phospholipase RssA